MSCHFSVTPTKIGYVFLPFDVGLAIGHALANGMLVNEMQTEAWNVLVPLTCLLVLLPSLDSPLALGQG